MKYYPRTPFAPLPVSQHCSVDFFEVFYAPFSPAAIRSSVTGTIMIVELCEVDTTDINNLNLAIELFVPVLYM
jgi:hypothetical protein